MKKASTPSPTTTTSDRDDAPDRDDATATAYPHQVGGHKQMAITRRGHILKPLQDKEHQFYKYIHQPQLPPDLHWIRRVTPNFYGETALPNILPSPPTRTPYPLWTATGAGETQAVHDTSPWVAQVYTRAAASLGGGTGGGSTKPKQGKKQQPAISNRKNRPSRSIALENITRNFQFPCVLDCKLGVRSHDDDATEEKRRRHIDKANRTTSVRCGVRYTGMQSYKRPGHVYEVRDKYRGRQLKEADLVPELRWFFHDGYALRTDCMLAILRHLLQLRSYHLHQSHFYFYSSSLLLVYEGDPSIPVRVDVRMIDFAHTMLSNGRRDDGYLKGINYLIHIMSQVLQNESRDYAAGEGPAPAPTPHLDIIDANIPNSTTDASNSTTIVATHIDDDPPASTSTLPDQPHQVHAQEPQQVLSSDDLHRHPKVPDSTSRNLDVDPNPPD